MMVVKTAGEIELMEHANALVHRVLDGVEERIRPGVSTQGAGFPGQLLQGDILQALSPMMQVRSDCFTIRGYGEAKHPHTGEIEARAWCEAVVQRLPDPVPNPESTASPLKELASPTSPFGRQFRIVSFRWLAPEEI